MTVTFEGDLIRPLGLVTLHFAYVEGELDQLLEALSRQEPYPDLKRRWPVGRKLAYAQKLISRLQSDSLAGLITTLKEARMLFERRNALVHGCIYAGGHLVSNRSGVPNQQVTAAQLLELAELAFTCKEHLHLYRSRDLLPHLVIRG